ncbi:MAG: hypothetical protein ABI234_05140 [Ktedonobacteraceae bacterium]
MAQNVEQQPFDQAGWGGTGAPPPLSYNPWGQEVSPNPNMPVYQQGPQNLFQGFQGPVNQFGTIPGQISETPGSMRSGLPQSSLAPRRPFTPSPKKTGAGLKIALVGLILATLLLVGIAILGFSGLGKSSPSTTNITAPTANTQQQTAPSPTTASASPTANASATGTPYPAQQYIDGAQMATGVDKTTRLPTQTTTTFQVGTQMYVTFNLHAPAQGGAFCPLWYLHGNAITDLKGYAARPGNYPSYTFANYTSPGPAYVEIYWASDKTCADKVLAQHVDFTVTN